MRRVTEFKKQWDEFQQALNNKDETAVKKAAMLNAVLCTGGAMLAFLSAQQQTTHLSEIDFGPFLLLFGAAALCSRANSYVNSVIEPRTKEIAIQVDELSTTLSDEKITQEKIAASLPAKLIIQAVNLMRAYEDSAKANRKMFERNSDTIRHYFLSLFLVASFFIHSTDYRAKLDPAAQHIDDLLFLMVSFVIQGISHSYTTEQKTKEIGVQADENCALTESLEKKPENKKSIVNWIASSIFGKMPNFVNTTKNTLMLQKELQLHQQNFSTSNF